MSAIPEEIPAQRPGFVSRVGIPAVTRVATWLRAYGRWLLLVLGVVAVGALVNHFGAAQLWATLKVTAPWLPLIFAFEIGWMGVEAFALLAFYGEERRKIPVREWVRSMMTHYATMVVLPVGRAGAEVARAAMLTPYVGSQRATAGAAQLQSIILIANAVICVPCLIAVVLVVGPVHWLSGLLAVNCVATLFLGGGLYLFIRKVRIGGWLGRRFEKMVHWGPELDEVLRDSPRLPVAPLAFAVLGRSLQAVQYGIMLMAVGGVLTVNSALITEGIHLVAAGLGDMVPNQVGVSESAYTIFAEVLGLGAHPEKALAIALVARVSNFTVAGACFALTQIWRPKD